jgi:cytochrome c553
MRQSAIILLLFVLSAPPTAHAAPPEAAGNDLFEKKIRPVLVKHCYKCHSADADEIKGNLRVDTKEGLLKGGDNGPAIVPEDVENSFLLRAIRYQEDDYQMPPDGKLPDAVIADFEKWVKMGAPDPRAVGQASSLPSDSRQAESLPHADIEQGRKFWAFQKPRMPVIADVKDTAWPRGDVDRFILAKLEASGIQPAPDAEVHTLIRRIYFDLIGLPPTPGEIDEWTARLTASQRRSLDSQLDVTAKSAAGLPLNEEALAELVDQLLDSPRFGERWGRHWLDVARYADSNGLDINLTFHDAWRYRDWVIDAFNRDMPYDQFLVEQLAGDLLPYDNDQQRTKQLAATGFLMVGPKQLSERDKEKLRMDVVDEQIDAVGRAMLGLTLGCARCHDHKFDPIPTTDYYALAGIFRSTKTIEGIKLGNVFVSGWKVRPLPIKPEHAAALATYQQRLKELQSQLDTAKAELQKLQAPGIRKKDDLAGIVVDNNEATIVGQWKDSTYTPIFVGEGYIHDEMTGKGEKSVTYTPVLPKAGMYEVRLSYTGGPGRSTAVPLTIRHADGETNIKVDQVEQPPIDKLFKPIGRFRFDAGDDGSVTISNAGTDGAYVMADAAQFVPADLLDIEQPPATAASDTDDAGGGLSVFRRAKLELDIPQLEAELKELKSRAPQPAPMAMAVEDEAKPSDCRVAIRGNPRRLGDSVSRGFVTVASTTTAPTFSSSQSGRLELARWIASPDNPLTARVMVNRIWQHLMGEGLVRSVDNFGHLGELPSHPELLDHLAIRFATDSTTPTSHPPTPQAPSPKPQAAAWSIKRTVREIILSRTYRTSARHDPAAFAIDPENRLHWRAERRRLDAEAIRDAMLAVSGQLDLTMGGSPVAGLPEQALDNESKSPIDTDKIVRRSVYLPILRSDLPPILQVFDFADPEMVTGRRDTTTVPAQALLLMNSPFVLEQSRAAAEKLLSNAQLDDAGRIGILYRQTIGREPTSAESQFALSFVNNFRTLLRETPGRPTQIELGALASLCQSLFASTEFRLLE